MRIVLALFVFAALLGAPAAAGEYRIHDNQGGQVGHFLDLFEGVRKSGKRVVIDGQCLSACTLVLSVVPNDRICMTPRAILGFHAARSLDRHGQLHPEQEATDFMLKSYPTPVRGWILEHGGLTSRLLVLRGPKLSEILQACS